MLKTGVSQKQVCQGPHHLRSTRSVAGKFSNGEPFHSKSRVERNRQLIGFAICSAQKPQTSPQIALITLIYTDQK